MDYETPESTPDVSLEFAHDTTASRLARRAIEPLLREDGQFAEDVSLAVSEIVTNVVEHTPDGGKLTAWDRDPLTLEVEDFGGGDPATPLMPADVGGHGMAIISRVADHWGVRKTRMGKVVWAMFGRPRHQ